PGNVLATRPLGYFDFLRLERASSVVITDSGGVQGESLACHVPCITIRETTERWESVVMGANFLAGLEPLTVAYYLRMIRESKLRGRLEKIKNPYGDGRASGRIARILKDFV
ncbi:MAG: UDP-N-acetylglucosamine 2-epimerase, partial [Candidatus Altiarchaeota archaeon]|nr:UDP-N-acetylglucosamine 2-epimerase [Candidatus Altiarchaeota archaeon]